LFEEIDYEQEADNAERFAKLFADNPAVYVPDVERMLSSTHVLTTTWIEGSKMRNSQELIDQRLDPCRINPHWCDLWLTATARNLGTSMPIPIRATFLLCRVVAVTWVMLDMWTSE
jgi:predicted unusual protein kinase regulating ubiquinone biosynthesis (AarF/ABC1/UbiB family)